MPDRRTLILDEVQSTQDAAIEHGLEVGDVCISYHQTAGRGRRGKEWNSTGGVAVTFVLESVTPHFPIAIAAVLASQLNNLVPKQTVAIKWPNDLYVEGKKLAGILIEQREGMYLVGVGVNVLEATLSTAVCLKQCGSDPSLESVSDLVVASVLDAVQLDEITAVSEWRKRDVLIGTTQIVQSGDNVIEGLVLNIDPCHNLLLQTQHGIFELPAATSAIVTPCN